MKSIAIADHHFDLDQRIPGCTTYTASVQSYCMPVGSACFPRRVAFDIRDEEQSTFASLLASHFF